mmetsp:Transcript_40213/g.77080  ORF Transcript_40213/g.77080 Transcript_40213/m.77080 type:complete len:83 (+) Transcript_40213:247-495(+)
MLMSVALALGDGHGTGRFTLIAGLLYGSTDVASPLIRLEEDPPEFNAVSYAICGLGNTSGSPAASFWMQSRGGGSTLEGSRL